MHDRDGAVAIERDDVVGLVAAEGGDVDVAGLAAVEDLADDVQILAVDGALEHQVVQRPAVERTERLGFAIRDHAEERVVDFDDTLHAGSRSDLDADAADDRVHTDADVQMRVAVDDVVAAVAGDGIAAAAAEQDVAVVEHRRRRSECGELDVAEAEDFLQTADALDAFARQLVTLQGLLVDRQDLVERAVGRDAVVADDDVVKAGTGERLDAVEAVAQDIVEHRREDAHVHVHGDAERVLLECHPVEAEHALVAHDGLALHHDVVAAFGIEIVLVGAGEHDVVADDSRIEEQLGVVARQRVEAFAAFHPVVPLAAEQEVHVGRAEDEVVALGAEHLRAILASHDEVVAITGEDEIAEAVAGVDDVVAGFAVDEFGIAAAPDDVVAVAAVQAVDAVAADDVVIAAVAPDGVVAEVADQDVGTVGTAEHHVLAAVEGQHVVVDGAIEQHAGAALDHVENDVGIVVDRVGRVLQRLVDLERELRRREHQSRKVGVARSTEVGVGHDDRGERIVLELGQEVHALGARQVVEAVAVLQILQLRLEYSGKGRAEHAAERQDGFREAADPEIHVVEATEVGSIGAGSVEEVLDVLRGGAISDIAVIIGVDAQHEFHGGVALLLERRRAGDRGMGAVGSNEVDDRCRVGDVGGIVGPARVRTQPFALRRREQLCACLVERRHPGIAAARDVDCREVERQTEQVVAQGVGDELVDLVAELTRHAADDGAGGLIGRHCAAFEELDGVEEGFDETDVVCRLAVGVEAVDRIRQHRVAEAVHDVCELGEDRGIDVHGRVEDEQVDHRVHGARELLEHHVLILHLGAEARRLEQALAVPVERVDVGGNVVQRGEGRHEPLVDEVEIAGRDDDILDLLGEAIVFRVEDVMDGCQPDVLVAAAVAGDEVRVEQFVIVLTECYRIERAAGHVVGVSRQQLVRRPRIAVVVAIGGGSMRDVVDEGMAGAHDGAAERADIGERDAEAAVGRRIAFDEDVVVVGAIDAVGAEADIHDDLRIAVGTAQEAAILVGCEQRHVGDIGVGELDTQHFCGLLLDIGPRREPPRIAFEQMTGCDRTPVAVEHVFAQEDLMRRVRSVGLVLIDERRRRVVVLLDIVGGAEYAVGSRLVRCPCDDDEVVGAGRRIVERIVGLERNEHDAVAALADEVETVVEELAEQREHRVERCRDALVRRDVRNEHGTGVGIDGEAHFGGERHQAGLRIGGEGLRQFEIVGCGAGCRNRGLQSVDVRRHAHVENDCCGQRCVGVGQRGLRGHQISVGLGLRDDGVEDGLCVGVRIGGADRGEGCDQGGRVVIALVDDQVRDRARGAVDHERVLWRVGRIEHRIEQARKRLVGGAPRFAAVTEVVVGSVDRAQAPRQQTIGDQLGEWRARDRSAVSVLGRRVGLGDLDLLQDEGQVGDIERDGHGVLPRRCERLFRIADGFGGLRGPGCRGAVGNARRSSRISLSKRAVVCAT